MWHVVACLSVSSLQAAALACFCLFIRVSFFLAAGIKSGMFTTGSRP